MAIEQRKRLGRGLDALLGGFASEGDDDGPQSTGSGGRQTVPIALVERNARNPRRSFADAELAELAQSVTQHGIVQPIVVRRLAGASERYEIVAGERRWRAAQLAGLHDVPVSVVDISDRQALEFAIVENVQRADLNPIEEARGYEALIEEFGYTQAALADTIGKSRVHVTNMLRLLRLPRKVLGLIEAGTLSAGHGRALLAASDPAHMEKLAELAASGTLSVRETERLTQEPEAEPPQARSRRRPGKTADLRALEKQLSDQTGLRIELRDLGEGHGELRIHYRSLEQLDGICRSLQR